MNIDLILKVLVLIVVIGISIKAIKFISSLVFKIAIILFIVLILYKMFI